MTGRVGPAVSRSPLARSRAIVYCRAAHDSTVHGSAVAPTESAMGTDGGVMDPAESEPRTTIEELTHQLSSGTIDRRTFLRRGTMLAVSLPTLSAIIAACSSPAATTAPPGAPTAAPGGGGQSDKPVIGFLLRNKLQARWDFDEAGFIAEAEKLGVPYPPSFTAGDTQEFQNP